MNTGLFVAERLSLARQEANLSMTNLAQKTGLAISTISQIEKGVVAPKPATVRELSLALNREVSFFYLPINTRSQVTSPIFFRKFAVASAKEQNLAKIRSKQVVDLLQLIYDNIAEQVLDAVFYIDFGDPFLLTNDDIEGVALHIREEWGIGPVSPLTNLLYVLENHGVICCGIDIPLTVDAFSYPVVFDGTNTERPVIFYSMHANYYRQRFTVAHELAHMLFHRHLDSAEIVSNLRKIEEQANRFASAFLLPMQAFRRSVSQTSLNALLILKQYWRVSVAAMMHRLVDMNLITDERYVNLNIERSKRKWNKNEPYDNVVEPETPYFIHDAVQYLLSKKMNAYSLCMQLGLQISELRKIVNDDLLIAFDTKVITFPS